MRRFAMFVLSFLVVVGLCEASFLWSDLVGGTTVTCEGVNDTAAIQAAVDQGDVELVGDCRVNGNTPIRYAPGRTIYAQAATVTILPGCARPSNGPPCALFVVPVGGNGRIAGGTLIGDLTPAIGFSIAFRADSTVPPDGQRWSVEVAGTKFRDWRTDAIHAGGNTPARGIWIHDVDIDGFGRNAISVVHADDVAVEHAVCRNARLGTSPGACIDVESNAGERVTRFYAHDVQSFDVENGVYMHKHTNGRMGWGYTVSGSRFVRSRKIGIVLNSTEHASLLDNVIEGAPIGVSIGAFTEETRSRRVLVWGNRITANRAVVLAGIQDSWIVDNELNGGRVERAALGEAGRMVVDPATPPPTPTPPPPVCP